MAVRAARTSLKTRALVKMEVGVLAGRTFGRLPATLKSVTANVAAQIVLWLDRWWEDRVLKELHTGIPFGKGSLFGKDMESLLE